MQQNKKKHPKVKAELHPRNKNRKRYNFQQLTDTCPELKPLVGRNDYGDESIDFGNPKAVSLLNKAILQVHYNIKNWEVPENYLCPPIPGRADYIHHIADLLCSSNYGKIPKGAHIKCLDVGVGANCIYPLIGHREYGWSFIGTDIDPVALESAKKILSANPSIHSNVELRLQKNAKDVFYGAISRLEKVDLSICNPPFHVSAEEAKKGTLRKLSKLNKKSVSEAVLNCGGQSHELWCEGGEARFVRNMIRESKKFASNCYWFSTLISKHSNVNRALKTLKMVEAAEVKILPMGQGNKSSRVIAWTFLTKEEQKAWKTSRWNA